MTDELDSQRVPQFDAGSGRRGPTRVHGRVPMCEDVLAQHADDLRVHTRAMEVAMNELKLRCLDTVKLGDELEAIEQAARRMTHLVDDLLDMSLIRRGCLVLCRDTVRVDDLVGQALGFLRVPVRRKRIHLECPLPESPVLLRCDEDRVLRLLTNLIHLAINSAPDNGFIAIRACNGKEGIKVSISDSGPGTCRREDELSARCSLQSAQQCGPDSGLVLQALRVSHW